jgi:hypothetical protein
MQLLYVKVGDMQELRLRCKEWRSFMYDIRCLLNER